MIKETTIAGVVAQVKEWKRAGLTIGLVPTMGFLHEGHKSLIVRAVQENDRVIVSDFVNPTQFAPNEDLASYPRDFGRDCAICEAAGADLIFHPAPEEMYGPSFQSTLHMDKLTKGLCGADRPTHFDGVCTVCSKLFHIAGADRAYFGKKDAQQLAVIRQMVRDMNEPIEIVGCEIVREPDGLAMSSRNVNLTDELRKKALVLQDALKEAESMLRCGETNTGIIQRAVRNRIATEPMAAIDYVEVVSWDGLERIERVEGPILVAVAAKFGKVRLIDNIIYGEDA